MEPVRIYIHVSVNAVWAFSLEELISTMVSFNELLQSPLCGVTEDMFWSYFSYEMQCDAVGLAILWNDQETLNALAATKKQHHLNFHI